MPSKKIFDISPKRKTKKSAAAPKKIVKKQAKRIFIKKPDFGLLKKSGILILFLFICLLIFFHFSAKAEIEISPKMQDFSIAKQVSIDAKAPESDFSKKVMAGVFLVEEKADNQMFDSTGTSESKHRAGGIIRVYNNYHLNQILVATTRFVSSDGKLFRSTKQINIPSNKFVDVSVRAAEPGPEYNIGPSTFSIPGLLGSARYTAVYGKSLSSMAGGDVGEMAQVSEQDLEKAEKQLYEKLSNTLKQGLINQAGLDFSLIDQAIQTEILESSCLRKAGDQVEQFNCSLKAKSEALVFAEFILQDFAEKFISQEIDDSKSIKQDSIEIQATVKEIDLQAQKMFLELEISAQIFTELDIESLKQALTEKSLKESEILLQTYPEIEKTKIRLFPFWAQTIPQDLEKIDITLKLVDPVVEF